MLALNVEKQGKRPFKNRRKMSVAHKLRSVRLVLNGASTVEAAAKYGDSQRAVSNWVRRFKAGGKDALTEAPRSGRPPVLTSNQLKRIAAFATRVRLKSETVSGPAVVEFIKNQFGVTLTPQHARRMLRRLV